eukprot:tig00021127_g18874.t1
MQQGAFAAPTAQPATSVNRELIYRPSNDAQRVAPAPSVRQRRARCGASTLRSQFLGSAKSDRKFLAQAPASPLVRGRRAGCEPAVASGAGSPSPTADRPAAAPSDPLVVPTVSLHSSSSGGFDGGVEEPYPMLDGCESLPEVWSRCAAAFKDTIALEDPHRDTPTSISFKQMERQIAHFATGLQQMGVTPGDRVSLFADNSHRWFIADQGIMLAGGVDAVRGKDAPAEELAYIFKHSDSKGVVADNVSVVTKLLQHLEPADYPAFVVVLSGPEVEKIDGLSDETPVFMYSDFLQRGQRGELQKVKTSGSDLATLIYTSGTTGKPKGVKLTHANLISQLQCLGSILQPKHGDCIVRCAPPRPAPPAPSPPRAGRAAGRAGEPAALVAHLRADGRVLLPLRGVTNVYTTLQRFKSDLERYRPTMFMAVPRILEKFHQGVELKLKKNPQRRLIAFLFAASLAYVQAARVWRGDTATPRAPNALQRLRALLALLLLWPLHRAGDAIVYKKVREGLGGRVQFAMSGGGSLAAYLDDWFEIVGVPIINGYGLTETAPVLAARRYSTNVRGTAGPPFPRTTIRVVDPETLEAVPQGQTGLVLAKGPQVMVGYHKDVDATKKVLTRDGWFNTGDRGWFTARGHLVLTGRYKDVIVLSNGENIEPMPIEDAVLESALVDQIVCCGQDQKQLGALIVPNLEQLRKLAKPAGEAAEGAAAPARHAARADVLEAIRRVEAELAPGERLDAHEVERAFEREIARLNNARAGFRPDERVGAFRLVLEPFTMENGLMTQTLKVKRNEVFDKYAALIAEMYH